MVLSLCCINLIIYTQLTYGVLIQTGKGGLHVTFFFFFFFSMGAFFFFLIEFLFFNLKVQYLMQKTKREIFIYGVIRI
jgi:hypothetical protein